MPVKSLWNLLALFLFTLMALSAKVLTGHYSAFEIMFYRALAGALAIGGVMLRQGVGFRTRYPMAHLKRCVSGTVCFFFTILSLRYLPLSIEQAIDYSSPILFTALLIAVARVQGRERIEWPVAASVLAGFAGMLMIIRPSGADLSPLGLAYAFGATVCATGTSWFLRDLGRHGEPPVRAVFYFMCSGVIFGLAGAAVTGQGIGLPEADYAGAFAGVAFSGLAAQVCLTYAWAQGHPLLNSVFQYSGILYAALLGIFFFGETIDALSAAGMAAICCAGAFSSVYLNLKKGR
ncbi:MAG: DMT family transporter [Duodenibacillus sp.]|nr:DMT family transporter [Duodenibacillus sp.]